MLTDRQLAERAAFVIHGALLYDRLVTDFETVIRHVRRQERERFSRLAMDLNDWAVDSEAVNPAWSSGMFEAVDRIRDELEEQDPSRDPSVQ